MHGTIEHRSHPAGAARRGYLRNLAARLLAGSALVAAALTSLGSPVQAECVTVGNTTNCTGNGTITDGIELNPAPAPNINVFNITGNIAPVDGTNGIDARTTGDDSPLSIFIDIAPFEIITENAYGIYARTSGVGSDITLINWTAITTHGSGAYGILAQTLDSSSTIDLTNHGAITTHALGAYGILAQTLDSSSTIDLTNHGAITTQAGSAFGIAAQTSKTDSMIDIINHGAITTQGLSAYGIIAQTFDSDSMIDLTNHGAITTRAGSAFGIAAQTSDDSNSTIDLTNHGAITTQASNAFGIIASAPGPDSMIDLTNWGEITTQGSGASGITVGATGANSLITLNNWANVIATGADADGIFASAADVTTPVTISLHGGLVQGGTGDGDGVELYNVAGAIGTLNVFAGATVTTLGDNAVEGGPGDDTVNNAGTVTGDVALGTGTNAFNNMGGGLFNAGRTVNLGGAHLLSNAGTLSPGGLNAVLTTELTGNYQQSASGIFNVDVDLTNLVSDRLAVLAPGTAMLNGLVVGNFFNPQAVTPGQQGEVTILTTTGDGVTNIGITAQDTAVADYTLLFPDFDTVVLTAFIDFVPAGLNQNQTSVAEAVSAIQAAGGSAAFAPVVGALLKVPDLASLADAYDQLGPGAYLGNGIATLFSSLGFTDDLMSCEVREGGNVFIREGQCMWAEATGNWFDQDRTSETVDFDQTAPRIAGGFQAALAPDWRFGMAFGYQRSNLEALNGRQDSEADTLHGGAVLKYLFGDALLAAAVSGGHGWYDSSRNFDFGGFSAQATASHGISHLTGRLRGAYAFTNGVYYVKPLVDLNVSWIGIDGFTESGGNGAALVVDRSDETVLSASPALEFGWQHRVADGTLFRPYVRAGVTVFDDPELALTSRFAAAPAGSPDFRTVMGTDDVVGKVAVGLDLLTPNGTVLKAFYEGQFGKDTRQQLAGIRASRPF